MEILVLADTGCESAVAAEVERHLGKPRIERNAVIAEAGLMDALAFAYKTCTARRVLARITSANLEGLDGAEPDIPEGLLPEGCTFKAEGEVIGASMAAQELIETVGGWFQRATGRRVSLQKPDVVVYASLTTEALYVGIDLGGPLPKREWRIMLSNRSLKSTVAASTAVYAGLRAGERIFDPLGDDGTLAIEAALLLSSTSPRKHAKALPFKRLVTEEWLAAQDGLSKSITPIRVFCDSLREMKAVRVNSKLAGIDHLLQSTRVPLDWADLKIEKGSVDRIITHAPQSGKVLPERKALQKIDDLFNQAAYLLAKQGTITCVTGKPHEVKPAAAKYKFRLLGEHQVMMGKLPVAIMTFRR